MAFLKMPSQVSTRLVAANPQLVGRRALEVMEEVIKALEVVGLAVWLDNHMCHGHSWQILAIFGGWDDED